MEEDYFTWHERAVAHMGQERRKEIARQVEVLRQKITRLVVIRELQKPPYPNPLQKDYPLNWPGY